MIRKPLRFSKSLGPPLFMAYGENIRKLNLPLPGPAVGPGVDVPVLTLEDMRLPPDPVV